MTDIVAIARDLWWVPTSASNAYLWRTRTGRVVVVDPGLPGDDATVLDALQQIGSSPEDVHLIALTHFHSDHAGAAAALVERTGARVAAGRRDASVLRGETPAPAPTLTDTERPVYEQISGGHDEAMPPPSCPVDVDLDHDDLLDVDGQVRVHATPGHTWGSIAIHIPHRCAVLTGDIAINTPFGQTSLGPFNVDRAQARQALRRLAALGTEVAGLGHGAPLMHDAADTLRHAGDVYADVSGDAA